MATKIIIGYIHAYFTILSYFIPTFQQDILHYLTTNFLQPFFFRYILQLFRQFSNLFRHFYLIWIQLILFQFITNSIFPCHSYTLRSFTPQTLIILHYYYSIICSKYDLYSKKFTENIKKIILFYIKNTHPICSSSFFYFAKLPLKTN